MTAKLATLTNEDDISIITLDDGKANVFSPQMIQDVNECLDKVPTESGALIITGRDGMFSAGFDLKIISALMPPPSLPKIRIKSLGISSS